MLWLLPYLLSERLPMDTPRYGAIARTADVDTWTFAKEQTPEILISRISN
jgi:hypothetical protein